VDIEIWNLAKITGLAVPVAAEMAPADMVAVVRAFESLAIRVKEAAAANSRLKSSDPKYAFSGRLRPCPDEE